MPKEKASLWGMLIGDEPGPLSRLKHNLSGGTEGEWGENSIAKLLRNRVNHSGIFQNVYVPTDDGTSELDVVLVGQKGLYVFESKAYGGKIYGSPEKMKWTQYLGGKKSTFYNPVRQNENHCIHLAEALDIPLEYIVSIIVFENRADLSGVSPLRQERFCICNRNDLYKVMKVITEALDIVFSLEQIEEINQKLEEWSCDDAEVRAQHVQQVRERMFGDVCPLCGRQLVERQGRYGSFIGCTGYPRCRYTRQIDEK